MYMISFAAYLSITDKPDQVTACKISVGRNRYRVSFRKGQGGGGMGGGGR